MPALPPLRADAETRQKRPGFSSYGERDFVIPAGIDVRSDWNEDDTDSLIGPDVAKVRCQSHEPRDAVAIGVGAVGLAGSLGDESAEVGTLPQANRTVDAHGSIRGDREVKVHAETRDSVGGFIRA